jgi:hypothetical protein
MDHREKHHQEHRKEREHERREHKEFEREHRKNPLPIHPAWLMAVAAALILLAVLVWTFYIW